MGVIRALVASYKGVMEDQWLEFVKNDGFSTGELMKRGRKHVNKNSTNKGSDDFLSSGSIIVVGEAESVIVTENGTIVNVFLEAGEKRFHSDLSAGIFGGGGMKSIAASTMYRFGFGGECPLKHRVYYFNMAEQPGLRFHTNGTVVCRIVDKELGFDVDLSAKLSGTYSIRIKDPVVFYKNVVQRTVGGAVISTIKSQMESEVLTCLQPAVQEVIDDGKRPFEMGELVTLICDKLRELISKEWVEKRGIEVVSLALDGFSLVAKDQALLKQLQWASCLFGGRANIDTMLSDPLQTSSKSNTMTTLVGKSQGMVSSKKRIP